MARSDHGHESSGVIAALGPGTDDEEIEVGDAVTFNPVVVPDDLIELFASREQHASEKLDIGVNPEWPAAFADYVVVPARNVVRLRHGVPIENGALAEPLAVALHAVALARVRPADNVLVIGGGPIGQSIVVALRMRGVNVKSERSAFPRRPSTTCITHEAVRVRMRRHPRLSRMGVPGGTSRTWAQICVPMPHSMSVSVCSRFATLYSPPRYNGTLNPTLSVNGKPAFGAPTEAFQSW